MGKVREHDTGGRRREDRRRATTEQKNEGGRDRMADMEGKEKEQGKGTGVEVPTPRERLRHMMESHGTSQTHPNTTFPE